MKLVIYLKNKNLLNKIIFILFCFLLSYLLIFQKQNLYISKDVLMLWITTLIPSLFPFLVFTEILKNSNINYYFAKLFGFITKIFKLPKESAICIITGFLCGYPNGAKYVSFLYEKDKIDLNTSKKLLSFINLCNPIYVLTTIGTIIFGDIYSGLILYISHILSAIIIGICYPLHNIIPKNNEKVNKKTKNNTENFIKILQDSIINAFKTLIYIFGFMVIFSILSNILKNILNVMNVNNTLKIFLCSLFEITSGINNLYKNIDNYVFKMILISFLISFSSFSVIFQVYSACINIPKISLKNIILSKILHGILSALITFIIFIIFPFLII